MATLALPHASLSGISRLQLPIPLRGLGPRTACRRCALEAVEKIVTGSGPTSGPTPLWGARSAWCCTVSPTVNAPLCIPAAAALRADLQLSEKLGIFIFHIGVMNMRSGQKLIRPGLGERATRLLRILHVKPYGGSWDTGRLATCHRSLQYPHLSAVKAGPFHHSAITKRPWHVAKCTLLAARRPPLAVCSRTGLNLVGPVITLPAWPDTVPFPQCFARGTPEYESLSGKHSGVRT